MKIGRFNSYEFENERIWAASQVLTLDQECYINNLLYEAVEEKISIAPPAFGEVDADQVFIRSHEFLRGQISVLEAILRNSSEAKKALIIVDGNNQPIQTD
jgi:hypothetical protein